MTQQENILNTVACPDHYLTESSLLLCVAINQIVVELLRIRRVVSVLVEVVPSSSLPSEPVKVPNLCLLSHLEDIYADGLAHSVQNVLVFLVLVLPKSAFPLIPLPLCCSKCFSRLSGLIEVRGCR